MLAPALTLHIAHSGTTIAERIAADLRGALLWDGAPPLPPLAIRQWRLGSANPDAFTAACQLPGVQALAVIVDFAMAQALEAPAPDLAGLAAAIVAFAQEPFGQAGLRRLLLAIPAESAQARLPQRLSAAQHTLHDPLLLAPRPPGEEAKPASHTDLRLLYPLIQALLADGGASAGESRPRPQVFISHAKRDGAGLADAVRLVLDHYGIPRFFDASDIQAGEDWAARLEANASTAALLLALQTDAYGARVWCQQEMLAAKRADCAILVGVRLERGEARVFPYAGNVRSFVVPTAPPPAGAEAGPAPCILPEALAVTAAAMRELLAVTCWRRSVDMQRASIAARLGADFHILPRPPEPVRLTRPGAPPPQELAEIWLYPDPPLSLAERAIMMALAPRLTFVTPGEVLP